MAAASARQAFIRSMQRQTPLPPVSPKKSPHRQVSSLSPTRNASPVKGSRKSKTNVKKSRSDSGLVSSFRNLSISPSLSPPQRGRSGSPRKGKHGGRTRHRSLSSFSVSSIQDIANLIKEEKCKNVIVMAGAGISTPSGIPDFRSPGTGLYDNIQQYKIPEPSAIFDIEYFWYNPKPFFRLAKTLYPGNYQPNYVHHFVKLLHDKGLLLRMYTQNIDGLERLAGIPESKLVEAHGTFSTASCIRCHKAYDGERIRRIVMNDDIPVCLSPRCKGIIKPNIVFFGEDLPKKFFSYVVDFPKCDLLLVMGTSLEVEPFAGIARAVSRDTPRLLINRDVVGPFASLSDKRANDFVLKGDIVDGVKKLTKLLDWKDAVEEIASEAEQSWKSDASGSSGSLSPDSKAERQDQRKDNESANDSVTRGKPTPSVVGVQSQTVKSYHTFTGRSPVDIQQSSAAGCKATLVTGRESLSRPNSVARQVPLLPFRLSRRVEGPSLQGDFKAIDPSKDLASAGIGLNRVRNSHK